MFTTPTRKIKKLLIANRGEIACRVINTAKKLGIETAVVCSEPDRNSLAANMADHSFCVGPAESSASYLNQQKIIQVAQDWGADAIHPGYGFLSENAAFSQRLEQSNILFIGPPANAMESMASKSEAKRLMEQANVPLLSGYHGEAQDDETLRQAADSVGYPVMLKAAAGGGGKGMRIVSSPADFQETLDGARREAEKAFGDTTMLVEKYLAAPRHIEVQIFFDQQGQGVYLFDRDCSIQRRHQKVVEEAPAPGLSDELRKAMGEAAVAAGQSIGYVGAGTVEFLMDADGSFYFMEMNTRLQVEHPVTEMVTGQDLVEWQIRVAEGAPLPLSQNKLTIEGHSLEVRLYAEEPEREFLPATGTIGTLNWPDSQPWLRVETGVRAGDEITTWYDPMVAKLVTWGHDRQQATERLISALENTHLTGLTSNRDFLLRTLKQPAFSETPDTGFIPRHQSQLLFTNEDERYLAMAAATLTADYSEESTSPWQKSSGWRLLGQKQWYRCWTCDGEHFTVKVSSHGDSWNVKVNGRQLDIEKVGVSDQLVTVTYQDRALSFAIYQGVDSSVTVISPSLTLPLSKPDYSVTEADDHDLTAPMNGRVVTVMVAGGQSVEEGEALVVLEAMKMEQTIRAPHNGIIDQILHQAGSLVEEGAALLTFCDSEEESLEQAS
ncbi:biotin carboxylase N-terminal domain-containing protein [Parendozoicomonas sp. Alg238-R29]|uniref:ATP-binding protein n=1 Tax=Parendozoicomonas sp. Alg238-R29 TaxID=2993446 RepID=UPI00248F0B79|nr:biotin carboxylase N-terminal domain-containing protein [Parendozoicomonas sp. Alg238-R29]